MASFHALFFDFSGTLIDEDVDFFAHKDLIEEFLKTYDFVGDAHQLCNMYEGYLLDTYNRTLDPTYFRSLASLHVEALYKLAKVDMNEEAINFHHHNDLERFGLRSNELHVVHAKMLPGGLAALHAGRKLGMHVGIISDYDDQPLYAMVEKLKLVDLIDSITSSEEVKAYKPAKRLFSTALTKADCSASEAIYVGDRWERDVVGAKNSGLLSVLIGSASFGSPEPDYIITNIAELPDLLYSICNANDPDGERAPSSTLSN
jgi:HAD superfamily hydrolase (TIGR01549 family)